MNDDMLSLPPHSIETEQSVLGGLLLQNDALDRIIDLIAEQDFYRADHRLIWRQTVTLIDAGKAADVITVAESLDSRKQLEGIGGLAYLSALAQNTPSAANIRHYAQIVREKAPLRALLAAGDALQAAILDPDGRTPAQIATEAESALSVLAADRGTAEQTSWLLFMKYAFDSKKFNPSNGIPLIRIRSLKSGIETKTRFDGQFDEKYIVNAGDLLIGMDGEFGCFEWKGPPSLLNQRVCRLQDFTGELIPMPLS